MRFLLDENLNAVTAQSVDVVAALTGDEFRHIKDFTPAGTPDDAIPAVCRSHGFDVLVTVNYKDFGAKKVYYQALLDEDVSVVVLRPGRQYKMTVVHQVSMLTNHYAAMRALLDSVEASLVRVTWAPSFVVRWPSYSKKSAWTTRLCPEGLTVITR